MAEMLGVVASGISAVSFALQLADNIKKLKDIVGTIKDAPEDIKYTINELETLNCQLADVEKELQQSSATTMNNTSLEKCLTLCKQGTNLLDLIVKDLDKEIAQRRKRNSVRAWLKKDTLEKYSRRLESAKSSLMLSYLIYSKDTQARQITSLQKMIVVSTKAATMTTTTPKILTAHTKVGNTTSEQKVHARKSYHIDQIAWLIGKAWHIQLEGSSNTWGLRIRSYGIVPWDCQLFEWCRAGDLEGVKQMFCSGRATPFCKDEDGMTLLHIAALSGQTQLCRFLIDQGADASVVSIYQEYPLACLPTYTYLTGNPCGLDVMRSLVSGIEPLSDLSDESNPATSPLGTLEVVTAVQERCWPPVEERPLLERLRYALKNIELNFLLDMKIFEAKLCCGLFRNSVLDTAFEMDRELGFFARMMHMHGKTDQGSSAAVRLSHDLTSKVIAAAVTRNVNFHDCRTLSDYNNRHDFIALPTAMTNFVGSYTFGDRVWQESDLKVFQEHVNEAIDRWLLIVQEHGYDREMFLRSEAQALTMFNTSGRTWVYMDLYYDHSDVIASSNWVVKLQGLEELAPSGIWELRISWPPRRREEVWDEVFPTPDVEIPGGWKDCWNVDDGSEVAGLGAQRVSELEPGSGSELECRS